MNTPVRLALVAVLVASGVAALAQESARATVTTPALRSEAIAFEQATEQLRSLDAQENHLNEAVARVHSARLVATQDLSDTLAPVRVRLKLDKAAPVKLDKKAAVFYDPSSVK